MTPDCLRRLPPALLIAALVTLMGGCDIQRDTVSDPAGQAQDDDRDAENPPEDGGDGDSGTDASDSSGSGGDSPEPGGDAGDGSGDSAPGPDGGDGSGEADGGTDAGSGEADGGADSGQDAGGGDGGEPAEDDEPATQRDFGQPADGQIRPGVLISSSHGSCTSNFIYFDAAGAYYIGAAAHCFSPDTNSGIDSCESRNAAIGSDVEIENAAFMGTLAYSSWQAMQDQGEAPGSAACAGNDFALVRIDDRDLNNVHPAAMIFEGPTALFEGIAARGDTVYSFGQSPFHFGVNSLESKQGTVDGQSHDGWTYTISTDNPGLSGDSGSAVLHESGRALGVLVTVGACIGLCSTVNNGVANLEMALGYANATALDGSMQLAVWPEFSP